MPKGTGIEKVSTQEIVREIHARYHLPSGPLIVRAKPRASMAS